MLVNGLIQARNAAFYFASIALAMAVLIVAVGYMFLTISVNSGRQSDLIDIDKNIQNSVTELTQNRSAEDVVHIRNAIKTNRENRAKQLKDIAYGVSDHHALTFRECALLFQANCFHRNSSVMNNIYLGMACGLLGVCLFFFVTIRADAISGAPTMWSFSTLISLICLLPIGAIIGILTLFLLGGANGILLTQVTNVVQVESPFGIAFACTLAAMFSDRILATLSRWLDNTGIAVAPLSTKVEKPEDQSSSESSQPTPAIPSTATASAITPIKK